jgi:DNA-binding FadR family transcriptional regulator
MPAELGGCLHSPVIMVFLDSLESVQDGVAYGIRYTPARVKHVAKVHEAVVEKIAAKDPEAAAAAMHTHLSDARTYWEKKFPHVNEKNLRWLGD